MDAGCAIIHKYFTDSDTQKAFQNLQAYYTKAASTGLEVSGIFWFLVSALVENFWKRTKEFISNWAEQMGWHGNLAKVHLIRDNYCLRITLNYLR
jgi:hypothetical protein